MALHVQRVEVMVDSIWAKSLQDVCVAEPQLSDPQERLLFVLEAVELFTRSGVEYREQVLAECGDLVDYPLLV